MFIPVQKDRIGSSIANIQKGSILMDGADRQFRVYDHPTDPNLWNLREILDIEYPREECILYGDRFKFA
jgi:hypothetical protein